MPESYCVITLNNLFWKTLIRNVVKDSEGIYCEIEQALSFLRVLISVELPAFMILTISFTF